MESVENWMWIIAGIIIAMILFGGIFRMFINHSVSQEIDTAHKEFQMLKSKIDLVCIGGRDNYEYVSLVFPWVVSKIYVSDPLGVEDVAENYEDVCYDIDVCTVNMKTFQQDTQDTIAFQLQRALKIKRPPTIIFELQKKIPATVEATYNVEFTK